MTKLIVNDGPEDLCFGCGHSNAQGLRLSFEVLGEGEVQTEFTAPEHLRGAPSVVHGGIQAVLLDEAMGMAIHAALGDDTPHVVTAEFTLRYRRPAPTNAPLRVRGRLRRTEGRDCFVEGEILGPGGEVLTRADARWRRIG